MTLESELIDVETIISNLDEDKKSIDYHKAQLEAEILDLQIKIAKLKDKSRQVRIARTEAEKNRESVKRKIELEREAKALEVDIDKLLSEARELIKDAPWYKDAFDWQIEGATRLPDRALLGDKRGMGKTLSALIWRRIKQSTRTLVCVRKEVASDFIKEIMIREPDVFVYPMLGATPQDRKMAAMLLRGHNNYIVVTNIESWRRSVEVTINDIMLLPYDAVILDEAHHIKNAYTGTAQGFFELSQRIPKVLELTGTPIKNRPQEMFSILHALYPDKFPTEKQYLRDYCINMGQNKWVFNEYGLSRLVSNIKSFYIARSPEDIGRKVPPPRIIEYELDFENHDQQKKAYKLVTEQSLAQLTTGEVLPIMSQLAVMTRQAQMVSWPAGIKFKLENGEILQFDVQESVKADWAEDLLEELVSEGERVVVFSRFKPAIYELKRRLELKDIPVAVITGDEKGDNRVIFDDFDLKTAPENPKFKVLLATYQTVGESANLNAARHMILFDQYWNPGNQDQAIGRIDRINSVNQATVHLPIVKDSIDVYMNALIEEKRNMVNNFRTEQEAQTSLVDHLRKSL